MQKFELKNLEFDLFSSNLKRNSSSDQEKVRCREQLVRNNAVFRVETNIGLEKERIRQTLKTI